MSIQINLSEDLEHKLIDQEKEFDEISKIEAASYPSDEAASTESLRYRMTQAPELFMGTYFIKENKKLIGYVCSTRAPGETLTHNSMFTHDLQGSLLCIHSVVVDAPYRRHGVATTMLKEYVQRIDGNPQGIKKMALLSKSYLVPFYESCGFSNEGPSPVEHGQDTWYELTRPVPQQ
eukprot:gb/GECH01005694.1/.p1 GENE.gb/GECH01005694.1/~~gb/GECH01005694.1/.p1  ORF type:complete len:177 (+),score=36.46 gb/GECH01005694.1/:1-531(+)